ncbi:hypothetical protein GHT06_017424 [Daphnia sinensis]|uniref:Tetraspanin n=1 Tax=Daphnia sinensis TaxID=1820382 RepID=A0AAD5PRV7_9CRUS|nr:hypothetical protein GHT06_017424 [Daphnia sinensis]
MALSGCYGVLKWIVFIVNLLFWLAGVGVLALSIWLLFDQAVVFMAKGAQDYATGTYILLAAGALMTVIGFLGCCGALRESQCLLGTFFVFLMIILVAEIAGGVWAYMNRADLNKLVQESVRDTVRRDYGKDDVTTKTFDMIQRTLKCCGAESYASWANSAYNGVGEKSPLEIGISALAPTYSVPKSCCADPDSDVCETTRKLGSLGFAASALGIVYTDGCAPKLEALLHQYFTYVFATGIGIGIIELLGMIFSMLLCCAIRKIEDFKA